MLSTKTRQQVRRMLHNKTVLVTGGTGSFGKTIAAELLKYQPKEIRIFSRSEDKQDNMRFRYPTSKKLTFILGDIRDLPQLTRAMRGVHIVFHAAAQKQVPASEYNVLEAVKTNVLGAQNVIDACFASGVERAIAISTDKAVEPVNAMGMSKALQEKLFVSANTQQQRGACKFSCVRYGNVLGSNGSVLEVYLKQIAAGDDLSITDTRMTRFLITLPQAVDLVFGALVLSVGGEIYVPDLPSHSVVDLSKALQVMYTQKYPSKKIHSKTIGIRVGEKIHETLISPTESMRTIKKDAYYVVLPQIHVPEIEKKYTIKKSSPPSRFASDTAPRLTVNELIAILTKLPITL